MSRSPLTALLASVPLVHLRSGLLVCRREGRVAFGTRAVDVVREFERTAGRGAPVLIYASLPDRHLGPYVSWGARFDRLTVALLDGSHPDGDRYRPPSTQDVGEDRPGPHQWLGFWQVTDLRELSTEEYVPLSALRNPSGHRFSHYFVPDGPTLLSSVDVPSGLMAP